MFARTERHNNGVGFGKNRRLGLSVFHGRMRLSDGDTASRSLPSPATVVTYRRHLRSSPTVTTPKACAALAGTVFPRAEFILL